MDKFEQEYLNLIEEWGYIRNGRGGYAGYTYHDYPISRIINAVKEVTNNGTTPWVKGETGAKVLQACKTPANDTNNPAITPEELNKLYQYWETIAKQKPTDFNKNIARTICGSINNNEPIDQIKVGSAAYGIYLALKDNYTAPTVNKPANMANYNIGDKVSGLEVTVNKIKLSTISTGYYGQTSSTYVLIGKDSNGINIALRLSSKDILGNQIFKEFWHNSSTAIELPQPLQVTVASGNISKVNDYYKSITVNRVVLLHPTADEFGQYVDEVYPAGQEDEEFLTDQDEFDDVDPENSIHQDDVF